MGLLLLISGVLFVIGLLLFFIDRRQILIGQIWLGAGLVAAFYLAMSKNISMHQLAIIFVAVSYLIVFWIVFSNIVFSIIRGYVFEKHASGKVRFTGQFLVISVLAVLLLIFLGTYFTPLSQSSLARLLSKYLSFLFGYLAFQAVSFLVYSQVYRFIFKPRYPSYILVLGQKLDQGQLSLSLRNRLDKAMDLFEKSKRSALLILSGGQTDQMAVSEAHLMQDYLLAKGLDDHYMILDDQSVNTKENFENTSLLLEEHQVKGAGVFVTSTYHVLRSAILAREFELDMEGVGSKPDKHGIFAYVFAKYIREFYGYMSLHIGWHIFFAIFFAVLAWIIH